MQKDIDTWKSAYAAEVQKVEEAASKEVVKQQHEKQQVIEVGCRCAMACPCDFIIMWFSFQTGVMCRNWRTR
jgi:hypothetical protein